MFPEELNWDNAMAACENQNAILASIPDENTNTFIKTLTEEYGK